MTSGIKLSFAMLFFLFYAFMVTGVLSQAPPTPPISLTVDQSGNGDYTKIQDAIDAVPSNNAARVSILVRPGVYQEKIYVPIDKPFITMSGTNTEHTIITWNQAGWINQTSVFTVWASDFIGRQLTIQNTYGTGDKTVALRVSGDRAAFYGCRILSHQDALFDEIGKHYYKDCYIQGDTDFIFGSADSLYENCHLHTLSGQNGAITAQRRTSPLEDPGFTFLWCNITGVKTALLGRPWGPYARVIFAYTQMSNVILPQGWDSWRLSPYNLSKVFYGEYNCFGPGAVTTRRVNWAHKLTTREFAPFMAQASALRRTIIGLDGGRGQHVAPTMVRPGSGGGGGGEQHGASTPIGREGNKGKENERNRQGAPPRALTATPAPIGGEAAPPRALTAPPPPIGGGGTPPLVLTAPPPFIGGEGRRRDKGKRQAAPPRPATATPPPIGGEAAPPRALTAPPPPIGGEGTPPPSLTATPPPIGEGEGEGNKEKENGRNSPEQAPASAAWLIIEGSNNDVERSSGSPRVGAAPLGLLGSFLFIFL
ncbi:PREDICTED: putative pectinesterase 11 [Prunus mume]|uniref:Pectinesterase n=1 Tax=Prunus mume TaxID=102107 RepID=A0ABM0N834_PRUMU|nr:PREDICTED: putative pectinesterase 11 [Prunus mume]